MIQRPEEQDRMGVDTVQVRINRRRSRSQKWHQWFGLGTVSDHFGAGLGLAVRMDGAGAREQFTREGIPTPGPVCISASGDLKSKRKLINWPFNKLIFSIGTRDIITCNGEDSFMVFFFFFFFLIKRRGKLGSCQEGWEVQDGSTRIRSGNLWVIYKSERGWGGVGPPGWLLLS